MDSPVGELEVQVEEVMDSLVQVMRHILSNAKQENDAIRSGNSSYAKALLSLRAGLLEEMASRQQKMAALLIQWKMPTHLALVDLDTFIADDNITLVSLRDQMLALSDHIEGQITANRACGYRIPLQMPEGKKTPRIALAVMEREG